MAQMITPELLLIALFGFCFAFCRELSEHAKENNFTDWGKWWNTGTSWTNKHEWGNRLNLPKWVFKTVLVWATDAEHFFQLISFLFAISAVYIGGPWQAALAFYLGAQALGAIKPLTNLR